MIILEPHMQAFQSLKSMLNHPSTNKVRIVVHGDGRIAIKQNEGMWSPPLTIKQEQHEVYDGPMPQVGDPIILRFPGAPPIEGSGPVITEQLAPETCIYRGQPGFSRCDGPVTRDPGGDPACASHQRIVYPKS